MKINWKVRLCNPVFWVEVAAAVMLPILAQLGLSWEEMDSWAALGAALVEAMKSPVILTAVAVSVWNAVNDPTTRGLSDSPRAMTYHEPA